MKKLKEFAKRKKEQEEFAKKARQSSLKLEAKMQKLAPKIEEREIKYQQDLEFQKKNNPNFRDYDENPLIIKNYERFFVLSSFLICLFVGGVCCVIFRDMFFYGEPFKFEPLSMVVVFYFAFVYLWVVKLNSFEIVFANRFIQFVDNGVVKRQIEISLEELSKPYFSYSSIGYDSSFVYNAVHFCVLLLLIIAMPKIIIPFSIFFYLTNLLIKLFFHLLLNKSLKGFRVFSFIRISDGIFTSYAYGALLSHRYFMLHLYNNEIYYEVKKYFLQKNINIDDLPKRYSIF
ncbi:MULTISPECIES: hypothetical protein [unclassified Campylobacter]|uniref:hypothetical protein n=1 Tax=unclassified Campylobacter TaxID=2593542 RepID=UPI0022E9C221|nr:MULTISPECIES: hypothetical protein [unclassified Campylobacter]MDA3079839.1 hypothetical protein [Campylobacter sp. CS_NA2]MDA3081401.1 hypothetical protein [Campylobacter sp. CS_NA1]MDA3085940.1 hypothetical protein [Campylobacter sp. CS_ED1]MDA3090673.1 hypothetical protein [Campylobacter sp. CS_ED2]WBR50553.1 hypothetical protein PF026_04125 [Campylobacter sp. CS_NA3]